jgi:ectoine hydroxylase-related dioxygenase (phytanoyl-CoA dioxygenase family)
MIGMTDILEDDITDPQMQQFDADGYVVKRQLFSQDEIDTIRDTFMSANANGPVPGLPEPRSEDYDSSDPLAFYPRMMHPHRHPELPVGALAKRYMLDQRLYGVLKGLFGEEPFAVQSMFYFKPPGARGQDFHQDNFYLRVKPGTCMAAWIAVDDADEHNGGMMVVPGSSNMQIVCPEKADPRESFTTEHVPIPEGLKPQPLRLKAGDVLLFNGSVIHGSYPNTSKDRFRRSLICHYVPSSTIELAHWYEDPMSFDGTRQTIAPATGGGPCGTPQPGTPH